MWAVLADDLAVRGKADSRNLWRLKNECQSRGRTPVEPVAYFGLNNQECAGGGPSSYPAACPTVFCQKLGFAIYDEVNFSLLRMPVGDFARRTRRGRPYINRQRDLVRFAHVRNGDTLCATHFG